MKFSDIVIAVASLAVVLLFLEVILGLVLIPAIGWDWGPTVVGTIGFLLSGLVVGVVFSRKIWEERQRVQTCTRKVPDREIVKLLHPFQPKLLYSFISSQAKEERLVLNSYPPVKGD